MDKKLFKETKLGKFLSEKVPHVLDLVSDVLPDRGVLGVIKRAVDKADLSPEDHQEFIQLYLDHERELYEMEIKDRDSARQREVELAKTGRHDFLMYITGIIILMAFCVVVYASIFMHVEGDHFVRISTMVETLTVGIAGYYFGSSKMSKQQTPRV